MLTGDHFRGWAMRTILMLIFILFAGPCHAEDPLETLNTIEDTLSTMAHTLNAQAAHQGESAEERELAGSGGERGELAGREIYFVSNEPLGERDWVAVRPCPGGIGAAGIARAPESCAEVAGDAGGYFWKSRAALAADLKPGVLVVARQTKEGAWFVGRVTDVSQLHSGYVEAAAPFKVPVQGLRVIEE